MRCGAASREDDEKDPLKNQHQEVAVLGLALCAMGEEVSTEMALRALDHVLQYGEVNVRRAVPLALALLSVSNPRTTHGLSLLPPAPCPALLALL
jgi:26S proteasome regulatory subunit N1